MLNAGLLAAETDYTKYKEMTNKEKRALLFSCYNSSLESLCLYENWQLAVFGRLSLHVQLISYCYNILKEQFNIWGECDWRIRLTSHAWWSGKYEAKCSTLSLEQRKD